MDGRLPADEEIADDRRRCWSEFVAAAESAVDGDFTLARALVARHPIVRGELRAFVAARKAGRIVRDGDKYRNVRDE